MPIRHKIHRTRPPEADELKDRLVAEWRGPRETGQPVILDEGGGAKPRHLYVVWDEWVSLNTQERSEVIMDAFEQVHGRDEALKVTVALGLTSREADRMRIKYD